MVWLIRISLLFVVVLSFSVGNVSAHSVIVSQDVKEQTLNRNFLFAVFSMRVTRWPDGRPIRVFVLPDRNPLHRLFVKQHLQIFPYQLRNKWDRQVFTGAGSEPEQVDTMEEMYRKVSQNKGAIGYIEESFNLNLEKVRVVDEF
ncbi:substrate-binding domain-containing protein [Amphritea sp. 2_MG-2023]|uniref:substrate-binding domain-containing protein n=1 Tax=Amphritea TaxID=515417 RepID=UPI001C07DC99|nr:MULTISPECIES: substrate-binding domain-containing protein [Amphritea]MBU2967367.1 substrate-binding domain-containing protein [Amphritea atlantica]MDO6418378.1 substrate-binding domain-containing protein [Amphritea sp. 2_MG-2023]